MEPKIEFTGIKRCCKEILKYGESSQVYCDSITIFKDFSAIIKYGDTEDTMDCNSAAQKSKKERLRSGKQLCRARAIDAYNNCLLRDDRTHIDYVVYHFDWDKLAVIVSSYDLGAERPTYPTYQGIVHF